jgi:hypothetical protein
MDIIAITFSQLLLLARAEANLLLFRAVDRPFEARRKEAGINSNEPVRALQLTGGIQDAALELQDKDLFPRKGSEQS